MKKIIRIIIIFFVLFFGLALLFLSADISGFRAFAVKSASMEPSILTGSLIITQQVNPNNIRVGDIITFIRPGKQEFITHRVIKISQNKNVTVLKTKGDNNREKDDWTLAGGGVVGKVVYTIPYLGYLFSFIQTKFGILFFILIPSVYIIVDEIHTIIRTIKEHRKKNSTSA